MTLFNAVGSEPEFWAALAKFFDGHPDRRTLDLLGLLDGLCEWWFAVPIHGPRPFQRWKRQQSTCRTKKLQFELFAFLTYRNFLIAWRFHTNVRYQFPSGGPRAAVA